MMKYMVNNKFPVIALICLAFSAGLFWKCFSHDWTYDDFPVILYNPDILSIKAFWADQYPGRPLRELSYLLDYSLWGFNPGRFKFQDVFWHAGCGSLLAALLLQFGASWRWALLGALLFLSHPVTIEVAANSGHRKDSLCLTFILLAVLCYLRACRREGSRVAWLGGALASWMLACLAKQHALIVPLIWAMAELTMVDRDKRILTRRLWPWTVATLAVIAWGGWTFLGDGGQRLVGMMNVLLLKFNYTDPSSPVVYYQMVSKALAVSVSHIVWPSRLAPEYTFTVAKGFADPWVLAGIALVLGYLFLAVFLWRRRRVWFFFWAWIGMFWLPVSNLIPLIYFVADRYWYTPLVGVVALTVLFAASLDERRRLVALCLLLTVLAVDSWLSWRQTDIWASDVALWTHVSLMNPLSATAFINLSGYAINDERDFVKARQYAERAVMLNSKHPVAHKNYAVALERLGEYDAALREYRLAYEYEEKNSPLVREIRNLVLRNYGVLLQ